MAVLAMLGVLFLPGVSFAVSAVLTGDTSLSSLSSTPSGNNGVLKIQQAAPAQLTLLKFNPVVVLPAGTTGDDIAKATLKVFVNQVTTAGTFGIRVVTSDWSEATLTYAVALGKLGTTAASGLSVPVDSDNDWITIDVTALVAD